MRQYVFRVTETSTPGARAFLKYVKNLNFVKPVKTDTYAAAEGEQMSISTFRKRINESETDAAKGNILTTSQVKTEIRNLKNGKR